MFTGIPSDPHAWIDGEDAEGLARFEEAAFWNFVESCLAFAERDKYGILAVDSMTVRCAREQLTAISQGELDE
jgi:hypothetical protein